MPQPNTKPEADAGAPAAGVAAAGVAAPCVAGLLIDAMNLAYWCGAPPSLRVPLSLLAYCVGAGIDARLYFDASAVHRLPADERDLYGRLLHEHADRAGAVPSGRSADGVMLRDARRSGACIISRDRYRDHRRRYRKLIDDRTRLLPGHVAADLIHVAALDLHAPLAETAAAAWRQLGHGATLADTAG